MTLEAKKRLYLFIGVAVSVLLLWILFRNINFVELWGALKGANYWWLIPNVILIFVTMYQRAYRWRAMVAPITYIPFSKLLASTCVGFMANNVLPLRLGEFVRAYSLASGKTKITKSASLATIFVERMVFDLVALLIIFGAVLSFSDLPVDPKMLSGINIAIGIALVGISLIIVLALKPAQTGHLLTKYLFFLPVSVKESIESIIIKFSEGLKFLTNIKSVISVGIQTIMIWILMGFSNIFIVYAFDLDLPIDALYVVLVFVSISILVPSSPGFVGVYHAGAVLALKYYDIAYAEALSFAIVLHATQYIVVTLMGFYYLKKEHLSLKKLEEEASEEETSEREAEEN